LIVFSFSLFAQTPEQVLATANGRQFTVKELPPDVSEAYVNLSKKVAETRAALLEQQIIETVFETEAKTKNLTIEKYLDQIKKQAAAPTEKEIQTVYDANRAAIGTRTLAEVRPQIVAFLREESENKALANTFDALKNKYKITPGKDVNALSLRPVDVLATVGAKPLTVKDYEEKNKITLYETKAKVFDTVKFALNELIYNELVAAEAKSLNVSSSDVVAREVSDKLREFTAEERSELETALRRKLSTKYKAQILLTEPVPVRLDVTTENAASRGSSTAPVTVVMFSDFQCSACAAAHPALKKVLAEYGDQVRFVVRNYPLMSIHPNAYPAALAARAAFAQGKFFEYAEILYRNQEALDAASLKRYAVEAGLNLQQFELDLQSEKTAAAVRRDMQDGGNYGINATPTVYVNGVKARVITTDGFREAIDKALRK
jgi:protein-disulfide isomerase